MENSSLKSGWTKVRFRLNQNTIHSALTSPAKDPELSTLVKEVQRQVILYGEDYLRAQPGYKSRKTEIEELIANSKKQGEQSQPDNGNDIIAERKFNRLVRKIYNYGTKLLVYKEKRNKRTMWIQQLHA
ncbi:uncharacterized protein LOC128224352 [Mya arenaria]|uniref:uncharacterized protein LOC128224352 n=1 Tax=Mya arenaria TaxID=6604 RepID=UPI0022E6D614|nr:uncharacterized protein LOC128224352 [Mya arenaria]